jgi:glycosyltransferase involved in cell wall biosynthesis
LEAISDQHLSNFLNASDAVLLPYRRITGSAALSTALSAARGVVVADLPYFREVLGPEPDAAAFFRPGCASDLASAIASFLSVPVEIRNAAASRLAARYDWPTVVEPVAMHIRRLTR